MYTTINALRKTGASTDRVDHLWNNLQHLWPEFKKHTPIPVCFIGVSNGKADMDWVEQEKACHIRVSKALSDNYVGTEAKLSLQKTFDMWQAQITRMGIKHPMALTASMMAPADLAAIKKTPAKKTAAKKAAAKKAPPSTAAQAAKKLGTKSSPWIVGKGVNLRLEKNMPVPSVMKMVFDLVKNHPRLNVEENRWDTGKFISLKISVKT